MNPIKKLFIRLKYLGDILTIHREFNSVITFRDYDYLVLSNKLFYLRYFEKKVFHNNCYDQTFEQLFNEFNEIFKNYLPRNLKIYYDFSDIDSNYLRDKSVSLNIYNALISLNSHRMIAKNNCSQFFIKEVL